MHTHDELAIQRACTRLVSQYAYLNDERRFAELVELFTEDGVLYRPSAPDQAIEGRQAILEAFRQRPADTMTFHVCSDILIEVQDGHAAQGRSRIVLLSTVRQQDGTASQAETRVPLPGIFRDSFRLTEQGWKFAERRGTLWIAPAAF